MPTELLFDLAKGLVLLIGIPTAFFFLLTGLRLLFMTAQDKKELEEAIMRNDWKEVDAIMRGIEKFSLQ